MNDISSVAKQFAPQDAFCEIRELSGGNINATFLVSPDSAGGSPFILQRINTEVFKEPELILQNMRNVTEHIRQRVQGDSPLPAERRWVMPQVLSASDGRDFWRAVDGSFWRASSFIEGARSFATIKDFEHAQEVGYAVGVFHLLLSDLPPSRLADTLEGFHVTSRYLEHYDQVRVRESVLVNGSPEIKYCLGIVGERRGWARVLEDAKAQGRLVARLIHGDPKVDNIMIDTVTGRAVSIIDLDTVRPGLVHYDIGDCLRSGCNLAGEETENWEDVVFDLDFCRGIMRGYLRAARKFLYGSDYGYMYDAIRLIAFELGLRFFTDYLEGSVYFRAESPEHNLRRALVQFRLVESIESQAASIGTIIRELR